MHSLHSVTDSSAWVSAGSPSALTQLESKLAVPKRDILWSRALAKKSGAGSDTELAESKPKQVETVRSSGKLEGNLFFFFLFFPFLTYAKSRWFRRGIPGTV